MTSLYGQDGDDLLVGGSGTDLLMGGADDDTLIGGSGRDVFAFDDGFGQDVINDFGRGDQINLAADLNGTGIAQASDLVDQRDDHWRHHSGRHQVHRSSPSATTRSAWRGWTTTTSSAKSIPG